MFGCPGRPRYERRSGGLAQTGEMPRQPRPAAPSAQQRTPLSWRRKMSCVLDAKGYNMDKPAPLETMGPVKKNLDPSAATTPDMGDAANPTAKTGQAPTRPEK